MVSINAGELRNFVEIQANTPVQNSLGESVDAWATVWKRWAKIKSISYRDRLVGQQANAEGTHEITFRCDRQIVGTTTRHRIKFGTRLFVIRDVTNIDERNVALVIIAKEESA